MSDNRKPATVKDVLKVLRENPPPAACRMGVELDIIVTRRDAAALEVLDALADNNYTVGEALEVIQAAQWWLITAGTDLMSRSDQ